MFRYRAIVYRRWIDVFSGIQVLGYRQIIQLVGNPAKDGPRDAYFCCDYVAQSVQEPCVGGSCCGFMASDASLLFSQLAREAVCSAEGAGHGAVPISATIYGVFLGT